MKYTWPLVVEFFVPGIPKPGGSKRAFEHASTGQIIVTDACKKNKQWRDTVTAFAMEAYRGPPLDGPLIFDMAFYFARPKSHFGTGRNAGILKASAPVAPTVKPDLTKIVRSTEDALTKILWRDDSCVIGQNVTKLYADGCDDTTGNWPAGDRGSLIPGVRIKLRRLVKEDS